MPILKKSTLLDGKRGICTENQLNILDPDQLFLFMTFQELPKIPLPSLLTLQVSMYGLRAEIIPKIGL